MEPFHHWREGLSATSTSEQRFDEWVFLNASSVLLSEKTGELLALDLNEMQMTVEAVKAGLERLAGQWGFQYRILLESNGFQKFIIYQESRLQAVLDEAPFCVMGAQLNYQYPLCPESFLGEVHERWETHGAIPHEIGVALGYPLDDVFGYMGLLPLSCKGVCGWRVYGCMKESQRRSCAFNDARCRALMFLATTAASN
ncbi:DUF3793 family protein [Coraliomargarita akajimensis]|uniref:Uncharacterized protein n=1 Tax=Coraliomargarita akajimensis (strain DSM 45221 / IAM 15411 / JCM 23193 / KCTC 12865 / 04OKA010-24) TaxID=583355 RepID=D5EK92_CORAD|nr:DUF3793 family protein [Coraliomargarita akajimensis]ADE54841.1 conserved hypothetical protein [Coraliomargarita akajimensis DSM 45221]